MKKQCTTLFLILFICLNGIAQSNRDTTRIQKEINYPFIALDSKGGTVLATNDFVSGDKKIPLYTSLSFKYGRYSSGNKWQDYAFGMPYWGVGIYTAHYFNRSSNIGHPISMYVLQGATITQFSKSLSLKYEWNLGASFNWEPYNENENPENIAIGSEVNVHVSVSSYLKWRLSRNLDLHTGFSLTHFSNGAQRYPNKGLNMIAPYVELVYNINSTPLYDIPNESLRPPKLEKRIDHDISILTTSRRARFDTLYLDRQFKVFGLNYAMMFVNSYKYKWGPSLDFVYDESSQVKTWKEKSAITGDWYDRVQLGKPIERFSLGLSLKGETTMENFGLFANLGYNLLHGNKKNKRLYQIVGVKLYFARDFFGTFGIRANHFSKAEYLYLTLGYTIKGLDGKSIFK